MWEATRLMNKKQFLQSLDKELSGIPDEEKKDILFDYREHFSMGEADGKSEEEIAKALGNPNALAKRYKAEYYVETAEKNRTAGNLFRAVLATLGLGFFNLVFVLGPFIGLLAIIFALLAVSAATVITGIAVFTEATPLPFIFENVHLPAFVAENMAASAFLSIGLMSLGCLMLIAVGYVSMWVFRITLKYLKLNINIIARR